MYVEGYIREQLNYQNMDFICIDFSGIKSYSANPRGDACEPFPLLERSQHERHPNLRILIYAHKS